MQKDFWGNLSFPIVGLSPMDGVTDAPMRLMAKKYGKVDVLYTEFVSAEGLVRLKKRGEMDHKIWRDLKYSEEERPVIAQLFGSDPEAFFEAAKIICELGFDGIDINMGCPSPGLEKRGGGAGLMRDRGRAREEIEATREGVRDWARTQEFKESRTQKSGEAHGVKVPQEISVSVKTRIGSTKPDEEWWKFLAEMKLPAVAIHGRTFKQLYAGEADWETLFKAAEAIRESGTKFLGNGDIVRCQIADGRSQMVDGGGRMKVELKGGKEIDIVGKMDGVLIGREAIGNLWVLRKDGYIPSLKEKLETAVEQAKVYETYFPEQKFFSVRKHLVGYAKGFNGSSDLRKRLVFAESAGEVEAVVADFLQKYKI